MSSGDQITIGDSFIDAADDLADGVREVLRDQIAGGKAVDASVLAELIVALRVYSKARQGVTENE